MKNESDLAMLCEMQCSKEYRSTGARHLRLQKQKRQKCNEQNDRMHVLVRSVLNCISSCT